MNAIVEPRDLSSPAVRQQLLPSDVDHLSKMAWHHVTLLKRADEGASYEEMAQAVGAPIGTVKSRLHRARAMLARLRKEAAILADRRETMRILTDPAQS